jgi:hypothetical protein
MRMNVAVLPITSRKIEKKGRVVNIEGKVEGICPLEMKRKMKIEKKTKEETDQE